MSFFQLRIGPYFLRSIQYCIWPIRNEDTAERPYKNGIERVSAP